MTDDDRAVDDEAHAPLTMDEDPCSAALRRLWSYLDKELTAADEDDLRDHLAGCPPCLAEYSIDVVLQTGQELVLQATVDLGQPFPGAATDRVCGAQQVTVECLDDQVDAVDSHADLVMRSLQPCRQGGGTGLQPVGAAGRSCRVRGCFVQAFGQLGGSVDEAPYSVVGAVGAVGDLVDRVGQLGAS